MGFSWIFMDFHVDLGIYNGELYGILQPDSAG